MSRNITPESIATANHFARDLLDKTTRHALEALSDIRRAERIKVRQCVTCFYLRRGGIAGQAFTKWSCGQCGKQDSHHNTGVPHFCDDCSDGYHICVRCGADLMLRSRLKVTKKRLPQRRKVNIEQLVEQFGALLAWRDGSTDQYGEDLVAVLTDFIHADGPDPRMKDEVPDLIPQWDAMRKLDDRTVWAVVRAYVSKE